MITKEQYLQAKKTIADYELQEYLSGNSGFLHTAAEAASRKGYQRGTRVTYRSLDKRLDGRFWWARNLNGGVELMAGVIGEPDPIPLYCQGYEGSWLPMCYIQDSMFAENNRSSKSENNTAREVTKSPLQEAMDRGYRKGAVVNVYGERYKIVFDPVLSGKMVVAYVQGSKDWFRFDMPIWMEGVGYLFELETEAPENKQL